ncbi:hypothetical protein [Actinophytocola sp.]|uniref:hypothetical protein n=1 Tax=Actinophytocola sp. TaxID=1872138 RepID=UPI002D673EDD|nr:hypothetical protein [Actinophytocola sp.]HYQ63487.1 hypothetical protein [Actinophytocola sp.]
MEIGSTLFTAGLLAVALEYLDRQDAEVRATERLRKIFDEKTPALRDAVYDGLAFNTDVLKAHASPETLDRVIRNSLSVRLGDEALAADVYTDLYQQVVRAPERHRDARVSISLSPWDDGPASGHGSMFVASVRWEYRVTPTTARRHFTCVSDLAEYRRLVGEGKDSIWYFEPVAGLTAGSPQVFELAQFTADGKPLPIRQRTQADHQIYTTELRPEHLGHEIKLAFTYRVLVQKHGHLLYLDIAKPTRGLSVELNYAHAGIRHVNALDFIASARQPHTLRSPKSLPGRSGVCVVIGVSGVVDQ